MAQKPQIIDITRSYVPGDPNAFPENLISTQSQDGEEKTPPISAYEGYNFMPTPYGYKSYFGTTSRLNIPVVPARAQFILSYQSGEYVNNLIALCEDGIWIIDPTANTNTWKHVIIHTFTAAVFEEWTWCVIENSIYCYKQGHANVYHTSDVNDVPNGLGISIVTTTPTFLNMAGQMGIFKAGTRLGFWDSANSVAWSSNLDLNDVTPSLENLAGNTIFGAVVGRITHIRDHGEGFIIYSTKSIVGVSYDAASNMLWDAHTISNVCGVAVGREVTQGGSNSEHFAFTTSGMYRVGGYNGLTKQHEFQQVAIELSDLLKESRYPVYLDCIEGRFLYLHAISNTYINGRVSFESVSIDSMTINGIPLLESQKIAPQLLVKMIQKIEQDTADAVYGATLVKYVNDSTPFDVIEWEMSFRMPSTLGLYEKWKNPGLGAKFTYLVDPSALDRSNEVDYPYGWDNRNPTLGVFVPPSSPGTYIALDSSPYAPAILPSDAVMYDRTNLANILFEKQINLIGKFQVDAFLGDDNIWAPLLGSVTKELCNFQPSYLPLTGRTKNGLLEEMYNIVSIWKDYEKRQQLVIDGLKAFLANMHSQDYKVFTTEVYPVDEPSIISLPLYKPLGTVGIQPMDKGFFFYKQYRDLYDFTLVATKTATYTEHKQNGDGEYAVPVAYSLLDTAVISILANGYGVATETLILPNTPHDPNYLINIIEDSKTGPGIHFPISNVYIGIKDWYFQLFNVPWTATGYFTMMGWNKAGSYAQDIEIKFIPWQAVETASIFDTPPPPGPLKWEVKKIAPDVASRYPYLINSVGTPASEGVPNPTQYSIVVDVVDGGTWLATNGTYVMVAMVEKISGKVSDYVTSAKYVAPGQQLRITVGTIPATHSVRVYVTDETWHAGAPSSLYYRYVTIPSSGTYYCSNFWGMANALASFPEASMVTIGNTYVPAYTSGQWAINSSSAGTWYEGTTEIWAARTQGTKISAPLYLGTFTTDGTTLPTFTGPALAAGETAVIYFKYSADFVDTLLYACIITTADFAAGVPIVGHFWDMDNGDPATYSIVQFPDLTKTKVVTWANSTLGDVGQVVGKYQSYEQAFHTLSMNGRYLFDTLQHWVGPTGKAFVQSRDIIDYYAKEVDGLIEIYCTKIWSDGRNNLGCVAIIEQADGFIYEYDVHENLTGSLLDNSSVELAGGMLTPELANNGAFNTIGAFFTPKNKVSCTIVDGALVRGANTVLDTYTTLQARITAYLGNGGFTQPVYRLPPVYDGGEYWWYMKDADHHYQSMNPMEHTQGTVAGTMFPYWYSSLYLPNVNPYDIPTGDEVIVTNSIGTLPSATYNLQVGAPAPSYPTFQGAYVFDLGLKKWGKLKEVYKNLISFSPLNNNLGGAISYTNFGMDSGLVLASNYISPFDTAPVDSWIRIGKIGYYRLGITELLEVKAMFRSSATGQLTTDTSLDGRSIDPTLRNVTPFVGLTSLTAYPDVNGRWHTVKIEGNYDLQYLEVRGTIAGRR